MNWKDAAKVSIILAIATFFTVFLLPYNFSTIEKNTVEFTFEAIRFLGGAFFTNFIALAGLAQLTKKQDAKKPENSASNDPK